MAGKAPAMIPLVAEDPSAALALPTPDSWAWFHWHCTRTCAAHCLRLTASVHRCNPLLGTVDPYALLLFEALLLLRLSHGVLETGA